MIGDISNYPILNEMYIIKQKIGEGRTSKIKICEDSQNNKIFAIKIFKSDPYLFQREFDRENESLSNINSNHVIRKIESGTGLMKKGYKLTSKSIEFILMDYCQNGCLQDYINSQREGIDEKLAFHIFKQLIQGIEDCHNSGFCHLELNPDNIVFDENFTLKLIDFGNSGNLNFNNGLFNNQPGYYSNIAPEVLKSRINQTFYDGKKTDIYSCGLILFWTVAGFGPYKSASENDKEYKLIIDGNLEEFWKVQDSKQIKGKIFSKELKKLLNFLLADNPENRPSINEIKSLEWMRKYDFENLLYQDQMKLISSLICKNKKIKKINRTPKINSNALKRNDNYRVYRSSGESGILINDDEINYDKLRLINEAECNLKISNEIHIDSELKELEIFAFLREFLKNQSFEISVDKNSFIIKAKSSNLQMDVYLIKSEKSLKVGFWFKEGEKPHYYEIIDRFINYE